MKLPVQNIQPAFAISLAVLSCTRVQAQSVNPPLLSQSPTLNSRGQLNQLLIFAAPPPPSDLGEPGRRSEARSRGCQGTGKSPTAPHKPLTALVPVYSDSELILGATIASAPTFWFYTPYQQPSQGQFVLRDKEGKLVYQTDVTLPETPGVVSLSLPKAVAPLLVGERYRWYFKIYCQPQKLHAFVEGWIQRTALNPVIMSQLEKATPRDRVALYAANGIWFEALSTASELRQRDPKDTSWAALLQTVGLNDLANEPIVESR